MKICLGLLMLVLISGCSSADHTQYLVFDQQGTWAPVAVVEYNIFKDGVVTAKITWYQKKYTGNSTTPGYMNYEYETLTPELEKLKNCTVFDKNNFKGELPFLGAEVKMVDGSWVSPTAGFKCVGYLDWNTGVKFSAATYYEWVEGTKHPTKHLVAASNRDRWLPENGYEWVLDDENKVKRDPDGWGMVKKIGGN